MPNAYCSRGGILTNGSTVSRNVAMATVSFSLDFHCLCAESDALNASRDKHSAIVQCSSSAKSPSSF
jgi:hypothetical protein